MAIPWQPTFESAVEAARGSNRLVLAQFHSPH